MKTRLHLGSIARVRPTGGSLENGFDNAHILVHKDCSIVQAMNWVLPLGIVPTGDDAITVVEDEDGPKGIYTIVVDGGQLLPEGNDFRIAPKSPQ